MIRTAIAAAAAIPFLLSSLALAQEISDQDECRFVVETVRELAEQGDVGEKAEAAVREKIAELESLCEQQAFAQAETVAADIRGLLATE